MYLPYGTIAQKERENMSRETTHVWYKKGQERKKEEAGKWTGEEGKHTSKFKHPHSGAIPSIALSCRYSRCRFGSQHSASRRRIPFPFSHSSRSDTWPERAGPEGRSVILLEDATRVVRRGQWRSSDQSARPFSLRNKKQMFLGSSLV